MTVDRPPKPYWPDYIQMAYLVTSAVIGIPLNIRAMCRLIRARQRCRSFASVSSGAFILLCLHLWAADLVILVFYCLAYAMWLGFWTWQAEATFCRMFRFAAPFGFHLLSNMVVAIAIHVASSIYKPIWTRKMGKEGVKCLIGLCWILAVIYSFPNCFLWTVAKPFATSNYSQCVNILVLHHSREDVVTYETYHLLTVFWLPLLVICPAYIYVTCRTYDYIERTGFGLTRLASWSFTSASKKTSKSSTGSGVSNATELCVIAGGSSVNQSMRPRLQSTAKKRKVLGTSMEIIASYVLCWLPYQVICLWKTYDPGSFQHYYMYVDWLEALVTLHACFNHLIYQSAIGESVKVTRQARIVSRLRREQPLLGYPCVR